jgi:integrase
MSADIRLTNVQSPPGYFSQELPTTHVLDQWPQQRRRDPFLHHAPTPRSESSRIDDQALVFIAMPSPLEQQPGPSTRRVQCAITKQWRAGPSSNDSSSQAGESKRGRSGIHFTPHLFRHTYATELLNRDVPSEVVQETHLAADNVRAAVIRN